MGFHEARREAVEALRAGRVQFEYREAQGRKNLLASGELTLAEAASIVERTRGNQAASSPHHAVPDIEVWVFRPADWYIKFYFVENCIFVSFHKVGE